MEMTTRPGILPPAAPLLVAVDSHQETSQHLFLPDPEHNIFQRLIRNPRPAGRLPREAECTEMLVGMLLNAPTIQLSFLEQLARRAGLNHIDFSMLTIAISTEQDMDGKRDDIRILAWMEDSPADAPPSFLWTIEVKVGAGFHASLALSEAIDGDVHQVINYDHWLARQEAEHRAGFVLALNDQSESLPDGLVNPWHCLTWTEIARSVEELLHDAPLGEVEAFLARHFLGFVNRYLVREMNDSDLGSLSFDDVALLRAYTRIGRQTRDRVQSLVDPIGALLEEKAVFPGAARPQGNLFGGHHRQIWFQSVVDNVSDQMPYLMAGVAQAIGPMDAVVWIETSPKYALKRQLRELLGASLPQLQTRNSQWNLLPEEYNGWWEILLAHPLESIVADSNPAQRMSNFVAGALEDLRVTGVAERLIRLVSQG